MANYLQRIADSGARTSSAAKPPAAARGLMPPVEPLLRTALGDDAPHRIEFSPVSLSPAPTPAMPEPDVKLPELSRRELQRDDEVETGKSVPMPIPVPLRTGAQNLSSRITVRAPEALRASVSAVPRERSIHKIAEETIRTFAPRTLVNRTVSKSPEQPETNISPLPTAHPVPTHPLQPAKSVGGITPVNGPGPGIAHTDLPEYLPGAVLPVPSLEVDLKNSATGKHSPAMPGTEIRRLQVAPASAPPGARSPAQPGESRRRTHISIGRIDVQVNNQATQPATPQSLRAAARMNSLEQRFLGRFVFNL